MKKLLIGLLALFPVVACGVFESGLGHGPVDPYAGIDEVYELDGCPIEVPTPDPEATPTPDPEASPSPSPEPTPDPGISAEGQACLDEGKAWICHYPQGNVENYFNICIGVEASDAHLAHDDTFGDCETYPD